MFHRMIVVAGGLIAVVGLARMATTTGPMQLNVGLVALGGVWVALAGSTCYELSIRSEGVAAKAVLGERVIPAPYEIEYIPRRLEGLLPSYFVQGRIRIRSDARGTHGYHRLAAGPWPELATRGRLAPPH
jgi:hypothetical protein